MGYQDRDYMRDEQSDRPGSRGSSPLWWILGLIAVILVVGLVRRGSMPEALPGGIEELAATTGVVQICEVEFVPELETAHQLIPLLKDFFRSRGFDVTIHESADDSMTTATFTKLGHEDQRFFPTVQYRWIGPDHEHLKPRHQMQIQAYRVGVRDPGPLMEELSVMSTDLRMRLQQELPGSVLAFDDQHRTLREDQVDW